MKKSIPSTLLRLARRLFSDEAARDEFVSSVVEPPEFPVGIVWLDSQHVSTQSRAEFTTVDAPPWMPDYVQLVPIEQRPGRHSLHDTGAYYCLDPSSVFMAASCMAADDAETILDVCASPGGKSVLSWKALEPSKLYSNEVIGKRIPALISNLKRCQIAPVTVLSADTSVLAEQAAQTADVVLVDAPCSGQSLIARGKPSPGCFHPATINMNANRQRRILSNAAKCVKPRGWLLYMTCTYSLKENERNLGWFLKRHPEFEAIALPHLSRYQSELSDHPCYRMWPGSGLGAGGFTAALKRADDAANSVGSLGRLPVRWKSD